MNFFDIIHPDQQDYFRACLSAAPMPESYKNNLFFQIRDIHGAWRPFESSITVIPDGGGTHGSVYILHTIDIISKKYLECTIKRNEYFFKSLLSVTPNAIAVFDRDGNLLMLNNKASEIAGVPIETLIGRNFLSFLDDEGKKNILRVRKEFLKTGSLHGYQTTVYTGAKKISIEMNMSVIPNMYGSKEKHLGVFNDITGKTQAEEAQKRLETELLQILIGRLSERETELLHHIWAGYQWPARKKEICKLMDVLPGTLDTFVRRIRKKFGNHDITRIVEIAALWFKWHT